MTVALALVAAIGASAIYATRYTLAEDSTRIASPAPASERRVLYFRDPNGAPFWSATPKKDARGHAWLPVYDDAEPSFDPPQKIALPPLKPLKLGQSKRRVLYYRNPMGLPDRSPVPKKDSMGMAYIPVYEGDEPADDKAIKVSLDRVQRSGVRTEAVQTRVLERPVHAVGAVAIDERRVTVVTMRSDGYIEDLFVNTTGQHVKAGEPLFRVYSSQIQQAQIDLLVAVRSVQRGTLENDAARQLEGAMQRLRNLAVPESRIREVRETGANSRTLDWPAPATGTIFVKRIINGQRVAAGDELYRIVDLSNVWVIADVAEADIANIRPGAHATVNFRAYQDRPVDGVVTFIYPDMRAETRTVRVRIEVANRDERLKPDMYADVVFDAGSGKSPVIAVPNEAVIDKGKQQVVLVAKGDGRFEPRLVKTGRRGEGYIEIQDGLREGEQIVTTATFLIDAESNLQSALKTFTEQEQAK